MFAFLKEETGERIRRIREAQRITQEEFAEALDYTSKHLCDVELGKINFSVELLFNIVRNFPVSSDYILTGVEKENSMDEILKAAELFDSSYYMMIAEHLRWLHKIIYMKGK